MEYLIPEVVKNKRILMRVDFNVSLSAPAGFDEKSNVIDDFRIQKILPTIKFLQENQAQKIILISHLGRPTKDNQEKFSLKPIALYLEKLINQKVYFLTTPPGENLLQEINNLPPSSIILLENIRYYSEEEENNLDFAQQLSTLGNLYINEAFSVSHHEAASLCTITQFLPSYAGFLLRTEMESLDKIKNDTSDKLVIILGGAKITDKLPFINIFINKAKYVLVGGALANTIIKSWNFEVGNSLMDSQMLTEAKDLGSQKAELVIPGDYRVITKYKCLATRELGEVEKGDNILDIGPVAAFTFKNIIKKAQTIFWNGPMGKIEDQRFQDGTKEVLEAIIQNKEAKTVIGGGDTLKSLKILNSKYQSKYQIPDSVFLSTGGGAMLQYLAGKPLPGLKALT